MATTYVGIVETRFSERNKQILKKIEAFLIVQTKTLVYLFVARNQDSDCRVLSSAIHFSPNPEAEAWMWFLNLESFEAVHGMSRIVKLIPDKLATAIAINREELTDPEDDGSFLVNLVTKLMIFYKDLVRKHDSKNANLPLLEDGEQMKIVRQEIGSSVENLEHQILEPETSSRINQENGLKLLGFLQVIEELYQMLEDFNLALRDRVMSQIRRKAAFVLQKSDQILSMCYIYMDLIHPLYLNTQRKKLVDGDMLKSLTLKINEKLDFNREKLLKEFDQMAEQHHFEE